MKNLRKKGENDNGRALRTVGSHQQQSEEKMLDPLVGQLKKLFVLRKPAINSYSHHDFSAVKRTTGSI